MHDRNHPHGLFGRDMNAYGNDRTRDLKTATTLSGKSRRPLLSQAFLGHAFRDAVRMNVRRIAEHH